MTSIAELLARAAALRDETALNSISPERAGGIMYDTLVAMNELWLQQGAALVISKIYASVEAMEADTAPVSDLTGQALRPGQIVVIASSDEDNGSVYRYDGTADPSWSAVGNIGAVPVVDDLTSDSSILALAARQGKVLAEEIGQLDQKFVNTTINVTSLAEVSTLYEGTTIGSAVTSRPVANCYALKQAVSQGEVYQLTAKGGSSGRGWYLLDGEDKIVALADSNFNDTINITIPSGVAYLLIQSNSGLSNLALMRYGEVVILQEDVENQKKVVDNTLIDVANFAEINTWYEGTTIGNVVTSRTLTGCYALKQAVLQGEVYQLTAKGGSSGRGWYLLDGEDKIVALADSNFNDTINITIPSGVAYLLIQSNSGLSNLALMKYGEVGILSVKVNELDTSVDSIKTDVSNLKNIADSFKCLTPFVWNKLSRMKNEESGFCNIGFIGDSWTQGTQNIVDGVQSGYAGYVEPLAKLLQDEYGFGGLGWLDFAIDEGSPTGAHKMFGCADLYQHWTYQFSGAVTGLDGSNDAQAPNCLGICCAHTIFSNGASLSLTFDANYIDVFKLRYYKNAHFNVSVNGGTAVEITANADDNWQETTFGTTGTNITSVVITSLADDTIIFGMDCFYGTKGVRCHKIGNRSIKASNYLLMDAEQWQTGISLLGLCWASVLLAINDLGGSTSESTMNSIVTNISDLINRLKVATDDGNGLVTCDINILGVENIESSTWVGLGALAKKQKAMALTNGYGWCSTDKCIGSKKAEFAYTGTFSDQIHLNKIGSYAYAKHIYDSLFVF